MAICVMVHGSTMSIKHAQKVLKLKTTGILLLATPFSGSKFSKLYSWFFMSLNRLVMLFSCLNHPLTLYHGVWTTPTFKNIFLQKQYMLGIEI